MDRYERQKDIFSSHDVTCGVVGVGAVGRNVVMQLVAMGVSKIQILDFDIVEERNLASQGFLESDLGKSKVEAVKAAAALINSTVEVQPFDMLYTAGQLETDIVFCCVDSMDARKEMWEGEKDRAKLFLDSRMSAEMFEIIRIDLSNKEDVSFYPSTLFKDSEGYQERCTAKTTIYCANVTAAFLINEFTKYLRGVQLMRYYLVHIYGQMITNLDERKKHVVEETEETAETPA